MSDDELIERLSWIEQLYAHSIEQMEEIHHSLEALAKVQELPPLQQVNTKEN